MDVFTRLASNDPELEELDERQYAVDDFIIKLAWALCFNTHLRRIVFRPVNAIERHRREQLLVVALAANPRRPCDSSWVDCDDVEHCNHYCRLKMRASDPETLVSIIMRLNE